MYRGFTPRFLSYYILSIDHRGESVSSLEAAVIQTSSLSLAKED